MTTLHVILNAVAQRDAALSLLGYAPARYIVLHEVLKEAIVGGQLPMETVLPPLRVLAKELGCSRPTLARAIEMLKSEGLLTSKVGGNISVAKIERSYEPNERDLSLLRRSISSRGQSFSKSVERMQLPSSDSLAFRAGTPPLDVFPVEKWRKITNEYWNRIKFSELAYSPSSGMNRLKENLANYLSIARGVRCHPKQIFVTAGSLQSIYQAATALVDMGDRVFVENPTFPNVLSIFTGMHAQLHHFPDDISPELREAKLLHLTPSANYPLGQTMPLDKRMELLQSLEGSGTVIIENEYEYEFNTPHAKIPSLYELNAGQRVIYLGTFNRLLHPSIRVGFMVVPPFLVDTMESLSLHSHRFVPPSLQWVMNRFLEKTHLHDHVSKALRALVNRRSVFAAQWNLYAKILQPKAWQLHLSETLGLSVCITTTHPASDLTLVQTLISQGIVSNRLSQCYLEPDAPQGLILGYGCIHEKLIPAKVAALVEGLHQWEKQLR